MSIGHTLERHAWRIVPDSLADLTFHDTNICFSVSLYFLKQKSTWDAFLSAVNLDTFELNCDTSCLHTYRSMCHLYLPSKFSRSHLFFVTSASLQLCVLESSHGVSRDEFSNLMLSFQAQPRICGLGGGWVGFKIVATLDSRWLGAPTFEDVLFEVVPYICRVLHDDRVGFLQQLQNPGKYACCQIPAQNHRSVTSCPALVSSIKLINAPPWRAW